MNEKTKLLASGNVDEQARAFSFGFVRVRFIFLISLTLLALLTSGASLYFSLQNTREQPSVHRALPMDLDCFAGKRILFFAGHPDDVVGSSGGFVSALTQKYPDTSVHVVVLTNGDAGCSRNATITSKTECASIRANEEKECDSVLGVHPENVFVETKFSDNHLWDGTYTDLSIMDTIVKAIRSVKPQVVITFFPDPIWGAVPSDGYGDMGFHPDHQKAGKMVASAVAGFAASSHNLYNESEYGPTWKVEQLWFWQFVNPTHCFIVDETLREVQLTAFLKHRTQYQNASQITEWMREFSLLIGKNCGIAGVMAEGFQRYW